MSTNFKNFPNLDLYEIILFDFDGTLMNTAALAKKGVLDAINESDVIHRFNNGKPWNISLLQIEKESAKESNLNKVLAKLMNVDFVQNLVVLNGTREKINKYISDQPAEVYQSLLTPNIEEYLKYLKSEKKRIAIVTNNSIDNVNSILKKTGLDTYFEFVIGFGYEYQGLKIDNSNYDDYKKPSHLMLDLAVQKFDEDSLNLKKVVLLGDSSNDRLAVKSFRDNSLLRKGLGAYITYLKFQPFNKNRI